MRQTLRVTALAVLMVGAVACTPTGDRRCDQYPGPQFHIELNGWTLNCDPPFEGRRPNGSLTSGWADSARKTVWVWPDNASSTIALHKTLWHEAGHTFGYNEWQSDVYAWCHMDPTERGRVGFLAPYPRQSDCAWAK